MNRYYKHLMSPLKTGARVAKTRFLYPCALPHFLQGPETFPAEPMIDYYTNLAKNGAAIIIMHDISDPISQRSGGAEDGRRMAAYDINDPAVHNYYCQLNDNVRYFGGLMTFELLNDMMTEYEVVDMDMSREMRNMFKIIGGDGPEGIGGPGGPDGGPGGPGGSDGPDGAPHPMFKPLKGFTEEAMDRLINMGIEKCKLYKGLGFAGCAIEISRGRFGSFMDAEANTRTDKYNGSVENRSSFMLRIMRGLKEALGEDFLIIGNFASQDYEAPYEDKVKYLQILAPYLDLIHIRSGIVQTGYDGKSEDYLRPQALLDAEALKAAGVKTPICAWTGFQDPALMDEAISKGRTDMISCARLFITNPELGTLLEEGRGDDVVPCVLCNKCHGVSMSGDWLCACTVNPRLGIEHRLNKLKAAPGAPKKVAVIGGGPVGMRAALLAKADGHSVTLFESKSELGGQLICAAYPDFKWPMARYIKYLIYQINKQGVDLRLNATATPEMIKAEGFDAVIAATGALPKLPNIPGAKETVKWNAQSIYGSEEKIGKRIVCIGGSESAVEAGLYLASLGRRVTLLTRQDTLLHDANPIHYPEFVLARARDEASFESILNVKTTKLEPGRVTYIDKNGVERTLECDDIVASGGMAPRIDEALKFYDAADKFFVVGDASGTGNVWRGTRDAFAAVSQL